MQDTKTHNPPEGAQRLSLEALRRWQQLGYGMFLHFGIGTFAANLHGNSFKSDTPSTVYAPDRLDVAQWARVARDAGMRYAILTTKHVAGHCLWPTELNDYHVGTSGNTTDVVGAFVEACRTYGVIPCFYYCSWDDHNTFGSVTPTRVAGMDLMGNEIWNKAYTTEEYRAFQRAQIRELLTRYGPVGMMLIDIPHLLGPDGRRRQYEEIATLCPEALVLMNTGFRNGMLGGGQDGTQLDADYVWPTDLISLETCMPETQGYNPWFSYGVLEGDRRDYYIPGETWEIINRGYAWFPRDGEPIRSDAELLAMRLLARERNTNFVLNVPPDSHGEIPRQMVDALMRLRDNVERLDAMEPVGRAGS